MTVDLENDFETPETKSFALLPRLLDLFDDHNVRATFFVVGNLIADHEDSIKEISKKHELASHSWSHPYLNKLSIPEAEQEIVMTKEALNKLHIPCKGFRAPFFLPHKNQTELLKKHGFSYDSSISHFFPGRYMNFLTPGRPYQKDGLTHLPLPNYIYKTIASGFSWYRLFHPLSKLFPLPYMTYMHPCELLPEMPETNIAKPIKTLYSQNLHKSWQLFSELVRQEQKWVSCEEYIKKSATAKSKV